MAEERVVPPAVFLDQLKTALAEAGKSVEKAGAKLTELRLMLVANRNKPYREYLRSDPAIMEPLISIGYTRMLSKITNDLGSEVYNLAVGDPTDADQEEARKHARRERARERYPERKARAAQTKAIERENDEIRARLRAEAGLPPE